MTQKYFCDALTYIAAAHKEYADLLHTACFEGPFKNTNHTFLIPSKAVIKALKADVNSDDSEKRNAVQDALRAHIIVQPMKELTDWSRMRDDIPNAMRPSQKVDYAKVTDKNVHLESGAVLALDTKYKTRYDNNRSSVWLVTDGAVAVHRDRPAERKYATVRGQKKNAPAPKEGGWKPSSRRLIREEITMAVENEYMRNELGRRSNEHLAYKDYFVYNALSLVNYILNVRHEDTEIRDKVLPIITYEKFDFYHLVEPWCTDDKNGLLDDLTLKEWWESKAKYMFSVSKLKKQLDELINSYATDAANPYVYSNRSDLFEAIDRVRRDKFVELIDSNRDDMILAIKELHATYHALEADNQIGGLGPILPQKLHEHYKKHPGYKMTADILRWLSFRRIYSLEKERTCDIEGYVSVLNNLRTRIPVAMEAPISLIDVKAISMNVHPAEEITLFAKFIQSTLFLSMPLMESEAQNAKGIYTDDVDGSELKIINVALAIYAHQKDLLQGASDDEQYAMLLDAVKMLRGDMSQEQRATLSGLLA